MIDIWKKIGRIWRYLTFSTTLDDLEEDIERDKIDFTKFHKTVRAGETFYRLVDKDDDPLRPSGKKGRFVSEPDNFPFEGYRSAYYQQLWKSMPLMGTGAVTMSMNPVTPAKEVQMSQDKDFYELRLVRDISVFDFESMRIKMRIPFDDSKQRHLAYQLFYGKKLKGVLFRSAKEKAAVYAGEQQPEYNLLIFTDWLVGFKNYFSAHKVSKSERVSLIGWRFSAGNSLNLCQGDDSRIL